MKTIIPATMKHRKTSLVVAATSLLALGSSISSTNAATIASYDFGTNLSSSDTETVTTASDIAATGAGLSFTSTSGQVVIDGSATSVTNSSTTLSGQLTNALAQNMYFDFTVTIPNTHTVDLTQISFDYGYTDAFRFGIGLFTDKTGFTSDTDALAGSTRYQSSGTGSLPTFNVSLAGAEFQGLTDTTINFRFYVSDGSGVTTREHLFDNILLTGDVTAIPEPSSILLSGLALAGLALRRRR